MADVAQPAAPSSPQHHTPTFVNPQGGYRSNYFGGAGGGGAGRPRFQRSNRKTIDYNNNVVRHIHSRLYGDSYGRERHPAYEPTIDYTRFNSVLFNADTTPAVGICTKFIQHNVNKVRTPVNTSCWISKGNRLITATGSGEFTVWNGLTFSIETTLQAHDDPIRGLKWSPNDQWLISSDEQGIIKYWHSSMNNVKAFKATKDPIRSLSFSPTSSKFCAGSDDQTVSIWDFERAACDISFTGHGYDVRTVDWHPYKSLIASGSKDSLIKLWDPRHQQEVSTIHAHKNTVSTVAFNSNGYWLASGSRDQLVKVYDIRTMRELHSYRGHRKEVTSMSWHPYIESLLVSGSYEGSMYYWYVGEEKFVGEIENAHELAVTSLSWHPLGHMLATTSIDQSIKYWARNRPGDEMIDKYNIKSLPDSQTKRVGLESLAQAARMDPKAIGRKPSTER